MSKGLRVLQGAILQDGFGICAKAHVEGTSSPSGRDFKQNCAKAHVEGTSSPSGRDFKQNCAKAHVEGTSSPQEPDFNNPNKPKEEYGK